MATEIFNREEFARDNIGLVYSFIDTYHIRYRQEEILDILFVGFTKALNLYDPNKGEFSTIAYMCMKREYFAYCAYLKRVGRFNGVAEVSLNSPVGSPGDADELGDFIADKRVDVDAEATQKIFMDVVEKAANKMFNERELDIYRALRDDAVTLESVAQKYGVTTQAINQQKNRVVGRLKYYFTTHSFKSLLPEPSVEELLLEVFK